MQLTREIRCWLSEEPAQIERPVNSWSGWRSTDQLVPFVAIRLTFAGEPDSQTGMLCDIHDLDDAARRSVMAIDRSLFCSKPRLTRDLWQRLKQNKRLADNLVRLELALSPFHSYAAGNELNSMVTITQQFEFSAAHRLHCADFSEEQNRKLFGKCNNPHGHGHNYVLEVTIAGDPDLESPSLLPLPKLDEIVRRQVVDRLDHRNLNLEVEEFATTNPTVEQIAQLIWRWLDGAVAPSSLRRIRVYETPKTWADVSANDD